MVTDKRKEIGGKLCPESLVNISIVLTHSHQERSALTLPISTN